MGRPPKTQTSQPEPSNEDFDNPIEDQAEKPKATAKAPEKQFLEVRDTTRDGTKYIVKPNERHLWHIEVQLAERRARSRPGEDIHTTKPHVITFTQGEWRMATALKKNAKGEIQERSSIFETALGYDPDWCFILHVAEPKK